MDPREELAARYGYSGTIDVRRSDLQAAIDDLLIMLAAERLTAARMVAKQTDILVDNGQDSVAGRAGTTLAAGMLAEHIGQLAILDAAIPALVRLALDADRLAAGARPPVGDAEVKRAVDVFREITGSDAPRHYDVMRVRFILEAAHGPSRRTALLTAAQTGQVIVGAYASVPVILGLVDEGLGEPINDRDNAEKIIGFAINDRGRAEAAALELAYRCTQQAGCPAHPDATGEHNGAMVAVAL